MDICFFCKVKDVDCLERNEFYAVDLRILRDLGHRVTISTTPWKIPRADLYVVWWWTWAFLPLLRASLIGKPVVVLGTFDHVMQDGAELEHYPHRPWWHRKLIRFVLKNADANVVVSRDQEKFLRSHFDVSGLGYSPHVIDTDLYRPSDSPRGKFFMSVCWMDNGNSTRKCIGELIRAVAIIRNEFPEYRLLICGDKGSDYPALASVAEESGCSDIVEFLGVVSLKTKIELLQTCELYLQPTRAEGFGVAILEAMSCGAPVVTSPVGAVPEVGGKCVEMVDGTDPSSIAGAVIRLLGDGSRRKTLGYAARERAVSEFSYPRRKRDLEEVIRDVSNRPALRAA